MKSRLIAGVALIAIAAAAVVVARRGTRVQVAGPAAKPPAAQPLEGVFTGRVAPRAVVEVTAPVEGTLDAFFVEVGTEVIKDQLMGRIRIQNADAAVQQAQEDLDRMQARIAELTSQQLAAKLEVSRADAELSRARADLERLKKAYERQKDLWAAGATARLTFEKSERDYKDAASAIEKLDAGSKDASAKAEAIAREMEALNRGVEEKKAGIERAKDSAASGEIHSPADGIVVARLGQPGDHVEQRVKLMDLATELTALQAVVSPDAASLGRIHEAQAAVVTMGDQEMAGAVQEVRNGEVLVYFNTAEPVKKLGDAVQVRIKF